MRVAILLQGDPRFCSEFDVFLKNLEGYEQVDWFMFMWKDSPPTANLLAGTGHQVVAPAWQHVDKDSALNRFKELLPSNHRVVTLELADQNSVKTFPVTENFATETIQSNVWKMWYSQYMANQLKIRHEKENNFTYDLVIRTRPDVALVDKVDLTRIKNQLNNEKDLVIIPQNKRCGYGVFICDLFGISTSENMNVYSDLYNQALSHHERGVIFHPETMLAKHLEFNNLRYGTSAFNIEFRHHGTWKDINTGEMWASNIVPNWDNKIYISDFGRWG